MNYTFKNPIVADLYALIEQPPLIWNGASNYFSNLAQDLLPEIITWDEDKSLQYDHLEIKRTKRLGHYAEELMSFLLKNHSRFNLLVEQRQIKEGKQTIGELDYIFEDLKTGRLIHMELSLKYYLMVEPEKGLLGYVGMNIKDRLGEKYEKMLHKQSQLALNYPEQIPELEGRVPSTEIWLKGRLFYPSWPMKFPAELNPEHQKGIWFPANKLANYEHLMADQLHKLAWLSAQAPHRESWRPVHYKGEMYATDKDFWYWKVPSEWAYSSAFS